nr:MAG TPA: hypothetical protein [Caudoviricetes sp.]
MSTQISLCPPFTFSQIKKTCRSRFITRGSLDDILRGGVGQALPLLV